MTIQIKQSNTTEIDVLFRAYINNEVVYCNHANADYETVIRMAMTLDGIRQYEFDQKFCEDCNSWYSEEEGWVNE
jgi:hypothetical protein